MNAPLIGLLLVMLSACGNNSSTPVDVSADLNGNTAPTDFTTQANARILDELPFHDKRDFDDAMKGLIATDQNLDVKNQRGETIWELESYGFIKGEAPASVNPSLWRQAKLNNINGLFKVSDRIYQVRGYDLANMSIIQGDTGWIIIDPLTNRDTSAKALALVNKHLGNKPVTGVILTHSHVDHFGGVLGVVSKSEVDASNIPVIAPEGFVLEATSENVIAGNAMTRRSTFSYGKNLPRSERGHIGSGLGKGPAYGFTGIMLPNITIDSTPQNLTIDGVEFVFQNASGSEAPSELTFYLPQLNAYCGAEVLSRNMHNIYTLRGAKVRDAVKWAGFIDQAIDLFGTADTYFASHHWPMWGNADIVEYMEKQRDMYKYIHDQTLRMANEGLTSREIAEQITMPDSLRKVFYNRDYYGTLKHNAKAVYQHYFGWYDGNPANLDSLPPTEAGGKYVKLMGGADVVIAKAQEAHDKGEYRWVAELLNHLVFAEPNNSGAKSLLANTYDQLAYQSESGVWRDVYLNAALELRNGAPKKGSNISDAKDFVLQTPVSSFFDAMSVRLNGIEAEGKQYIINIHVTDLGEKYVLKLKNAVLHHKQTELNPKANAGIAISHDLLVDLLIGDAGIKELVGSDQLETQGSTLDLIRFFALLETPKTTFNVVTP